MMDGVVGRSLLRGEPMKRVVKLPAEPKPSLMVPSGNLLDLRPSSAPLPVAAAMPAIRPAATSQAFAFPSRVSLHHLPMPKMTWLIAGGLSAAVVATGLLSINRVLTAPAKALSASKQAAAFTPDAATPIATANSSASGAELATGVTAIQIKSVLDDFAANAGAPVFLSVKDLKTGQSSAVGADQSITSASLYKLFAAHGIYRMVDTGKLSLSSPVPSLGNNVGECLSAMISVSDNDCGVALESMLGDGGYNKNLAEYGFTKTRFDYPTVTSAGDVALLLERLYNSTLLSPNSTQQFTDLLKKQRINNRLPQGLPAGTVMAHKTGDVFNFVHDAGIVYGPKTDYLVVMMSGPWGGVTNAPPKFAELSSKLYTLFNQ